MNDMNRMEFVKEYNKKQYYMDKDLQFDVLNLRFNFDLNGITNDEDFERLCHYIYFEHRCDAQNYPYSITMAVAGSLYNKFNYGKKGYDFELYAKFMHQIDEQYERDVVAYSKFKFREKFKNANEKRWWNIW